MLYRCCAPRGEQSNDMQGEDNTRRGGRGQGAAANAWGDHDTGSMDQSGGNLGNGGKVKSGFLNTWLGDKNKGDNYVVISLWLVTSLVHCLVMAPTDF